MKLAGSTPMADTGGGANTMGASGLGANTMVVSGLGADSIDLSSIPGADFTASNLGNAPAILALSGLSATGGELSATGGGNSALMNELGGKSYRTYLEDTTAAAQAMGKSSFGNNEERAQAKSAYREDRIKSGLMSAVQSVQAALDATS